MPGSGLSARLALIYIMNLPMDSATMAEIQGGAEFRGWGINSYLLAQIIDSVRELTYVYVSSHAKRKPKPPEPYPRPKKAKKLKNNKFSVMARLAYTAGKTKKGI